MITKFKKFLNENIIDLNDQLYNLVEDYLGAALGTINEDEDEFENKTIYDFSYNARKQAENEIKWFINTAIELDEDIFEDVPEDKIGGNIWYQRNGHGVGFWDTIYDKQKNELIRLLLDQLGEIHIEVNSKDEIIFWGGLKNYKNFNFEEYQRNMKIKKYNL